MESHRRIGEVNEAVESRAGPPANTAAARCIRRARRQDIRILNDHKARKPPRAGRVEAEHCVRRHRHRADFAALRRQNEGSTSTFGVVATRAFQLAPGLDHQIACDPIRTGRQIDGLAWPDVPRSGDLCVGRQEYMAVGE